jgi:hypothetical protein
MGGFNLMATTTNNGWATPDDTAFVYQGAQAMRTLGQAIDTSVGTGLLAWTSYAPTLSGGWANGNGTYGYAKYAKLGKLVFFAVDFTIGSTTTKGTTLTMSLPVTASSSFMLFNPQGIGSVGGTVYHTIWFGSTTSTITMAVLNSAGTYTTRTGITAAIPGTWATGDIFRVSGFYEAA